MEVCFFFLTWDGNTFQYLRNFRRIKNIFIPNLIGKHNVGQIHHPLKSLEASCWLLFALLIWSFSERWEIDESVTETLALRLRNNRAFHEFCRAACQSFDRAALKNIQQLLWVLKTLGGVTLNNQGALDLSSGAALRSQNGQRLSWWRLAGAIWCCWGINVWAQPGKAASLPTPIPRSSLNQRLGFHRNGTWRWK